MHVNQKKLTLPFPLLERQRVSNTNHLRIMKKGKSIVCKRDLNHDQDRAGMVLGLFMDSMTTYFPNQVAIDEQIGGSLKKGNIRKMDVGVLPLPPREQYLLPHQMPTQSNQKSKQKQISKGNNDQERRHPCNNMIPMSYAHLLPILVNDGSIVPKQIESSRFPYHPKHDPNATCRYHVRHVGYSIENCYPFKDKVQ